jgi:hypothetical protein
MSPDMDLTPEQIEKMSDIQCTATNVSMTEPLVCADCGCGRFIKKGEFLSYAQWSSDLGRHPIGDPRPLDELVTGQECLWALTRPADGLVRRFAETRERLLEELELKHDAAAHARITQLEQALRELVDENLLDNAEQAKRAGMGHVTACLSLRWIESARQAVGT